MLLYSNIFFAPTQVLTVILVVPAVAITSHLYNPKLPDGREFSEAAWYSVAIVKLSQQTLSDFDAFLSFVSSASVNSPQHTVYAVTRSWSGHKMFQILSVPGDAKST